MEDNYQQLHVDKYLPSGLSFGRYSSELGRVTNTVTEISCNFLVVL